MEYCVAGRRRGRHPQNRSSRTPVLRTQERDPRADRVVRRLGRRGSIARSATNERTERTIEVSGLLIFGVIASSLWASLDAANLREGGATWRDVGAHPAVVVFGCLLAWVVAFPYYLLRRAHYLSSMVIAHGPAALGAGARTPSTDVVPGPCSACGSARLADEVFGTNCGVHRTD